mmetsp:Transcript_53773/g.126873  ORF Transcript_53773/g.126873 Transcript_53773/m.126873 type:complete len:221 (+) Transcript_53773:1408-2070(+)
MGAARRVLQLHPAGGCRRPRALCRHRRRPAARGLAGRRAGHDRLRRPCRAARADRGPRAGRAAAPVLRRPHGGRQRGGRWRRAGLFRLPDPSRWFRPLPADRPGPHGAGGRPHAAAAVRDRGLPDDGPAGLPGRAPAVAAAARDRALAGDAGRQHRRRQRPRAGARRRAAAGAHPPGRRDRKRPGGQPVPLRRLPRLCRAGAHPHRRAARAPAHRPADLR